MKVVIFKLVALSYWHVTSLSLGSTSYGQVQGLLSHRGALQGNTRSRSCDKQSPTWAVPLLAFVLRAAWRVWVHQLARWV